MQEGKTERIDEFLAAVKSSVDAFAERKGYHDGQQNTLGPITRLLGVDQGHAIGEIATKLIEFKREPRRVLAEKIAGWAWRLWLTVPDESDSRPTEPGRRY